MQFITLLHQQNVLKTEETTEMFLRIATELCVHACVKTATSIETGGANGKGATTKQFAYNVIDAFSSMLAILVKYASTDPQSVTSRVQFLNRILGAVARVLLNDVAEAASAARGSRRVPFDQRPYYRIFVNLLRDQNAADPVVEQDNLQVLGAFANAFHALRPQAAPSFAFAWLELISHRHFMPALLLAKVRVSVV